jgi:TRAP transporter TAXI family solute receptor
MSGRIMAAIAASWLAAAGAAGAQTVGVGTMPQGTLSFSTGSVIAKVMKEAMDVEARVQPNSGETVLIPLVNSGELDFGIANVLEAAEAAAGQGVFAGQPQENLRVAAALYPLRVAFFARADSDIHTLQDLKGKRVTLGFSAMGAVDTIARAVLANGGVSEDDVTPVLVPNVVVGADQFLNDRADAFFFAVGAAKPAEVNASVPIRVIPMQESAEAVERLHTVFPDSYVAIAPPLPNFAGVFEPTPVLGYDNLLLTNADVADALVTKVLDGLADNQEALIAGFPLFRGLDPDKLYKENLATPFHPATAAWASAR